MKKVYVLDTNVLIYDPESLFKFEDNDVVIPIFVVEEVDKFKREQTDRGKNARAVCRHLDKLREGGSLKTGVPLPGGGTLTVKVPLSKPELYSAFDKESMDQAILQTALFVKQDLSDRKVVFVTMDTNLRVRSDSYGLDTETYEAPRVNVESVTGSILQLDVDPMDIDTLHSDKEGLDLTDFRAEYGLTEGIFENRSLILRSNKNPNQTGLARVSKGRVRKLGLPKSPILGIRPKNVEQSFALDLLLDPSIHLVTLLGIAGSGKTLLAILAGLDQLLKGKYERILITRPVIPLGRDIGFLPGDITEKLSPWMQPIYDNLAQILKEGKVAETMEQLKEREAIKMEPLTYIRGRSLQNQFIIADECFPYKINIMTRKGPIQIGHLFKQWIKDKELPEVLTFLENTGEFGYRKITQMWHRGKKPTVTVHASNRKIRCTPNHKFLTERGWVEASNLVSGDLLVASEPQTSHVIQVLNETQTQIVIGSYLGDGGFNTYRKGSSRLRLTHGRHQKDYCDWKLSFFGVKSREVLGAGYNPDEPKFTGQTLTFGTDYNLQTPKKEIDPKILNDMDVRGLAIWFMDDGSTSNHMGGTFHTQSFTEDTVRNLSTFLSRRFGLMSTPRNHGKGWLLTLRKYDYMKLCELIAPWVHPNLSYKIHPDYASLVGTAVWDSVQIKYGYVLVKGVVSSSKEEHVFDMEVEETHNFCVSDSGHGGLDTSSVVAHNCQNMSLHEAKTLISRCGANTKIVLTGDPFQIDNPYVDSSTNGLSVVSHKFQGESLAGSVALMKGERSPLSELATKLL